MKIDVSQISKLANLPLSNVEKKKLEKQLSDILEYMEKLIKADTSKVEATSQVTGLENITREDTAAASMSQEAALSGTKKKHNGFFKVPAILEED